MEKIDSYKRTQLHYVAGDIEEHSQVDIARELIQSGIGVNEIDVNGETALHSATNHNCYHLAELLIESGALIDAQDKNGNTPLSNAVFSSRGDGKIIKLLRARGANPLLENHHGVSPVALANSIANYDVARYFSDLSESTS